MTTETDITNTEDQLKKTGFKLRGLRAMRDKLGGMSARIGERVAVEAIVGKEDSAALEAMLADEYRTVRSELEAALELLGHYEDNDWDENSE